MKWGVVVLQKRSCAVMGMAGGGGLCCFNDVLVKGMALCLSLCMQSGHRWWSGRQSQVGTGEFSQP